MLIAAGYSSASATSQFLALLDSAVQSLVFVDFMLLLYVSWLGTCLVNDLSHLILVTPVTNLHMDLFGFFIHFSSSCSLNCYIWCEVVALRLRIRADIFRKNLDLESILDLHTTQSVGLCSVFALLPVH